MIVKKYIEENLKHLDQSYKKEKDPKRALYFSKLAILELCGWIEISMDDLILRHCKRKISLAANRKIVEENVKRTYGFEYEKHFQKMLIGLIGVPTYEKVERSVNSATLAKFRSQLESLKRIRDRLAHTYIQGAAPLTALDAPSVTISRLNDLYNGLCEFQKRLNSL